MLKKCLTCAAWKTSSKSVKAKYGTLRATRTRVRAHTTAVAGIPGTCGEATQTLGEHANPTQKDPDEDCVHGLPAVRDEPLQLSQLHSMSFMNEDF